MAPRLSFRSSGFYIVALVGWVAMTLLAVYMAASEAIKDTEQEFRAHAAEVTTEVRQKLHANEAVLAAFTSFLSAIEGSDRTAAVRFSRSMLAAYPHIYMLEVARGVKKEDREKFTRMIRATWQTDFDIKYFDYSGTWQWSSVGHRAEYWPLIYLHPEFPEAKAVHGLDLSSVQQLAAPLELSRRTAGAVSSAPFRLVEGTVGYVLFQSVSRPVRGPVTKAFDGELVALLVLKTDSLSPKWLADHVGMSMRMLPEGLGSAPLFERTPAPMHWTETAFLPRLATQADSGSLAQPIRLTFSRQVRWADVSGVGLRAVAVLSLLSLALVMLYLRWHYQAMLRANAEHQRAEFLAMHDPLTGLPNRTLIADRIRQALLRQQRHGSMFALLMIDLDRFKEINDEFGHEGGDATLMAVARRISDTLRATDTVARYGGDEFIVLVSDLPDQDNAVKVAEKLLQVVAQPIVFLDRTIHVTCSVGLAICPRDGTDQEALSRQADHAMYRVKAGGRNGMMLAHEST